MDDTNDDVCWGCGQRMDPALVALIDAAFDDPAAAAELATRPGHAACLEDWQ